MNAIEVLTRSFRRYEWAIANGSGVLAEQFLISMERQVRDLEAEGYV